MKRFIIATLVVVAAPLIFAGAPAPVPASGSCASLASLLTLPNTTITLAQSVNAGAFRPPPKVESAVIRVTPRQRPIISGGELQSFQTFVQAAFGQRRKQIQKVLRSLRGLTRDEADGALARVGIDRTARPESISPEAFVRLFRAM